MRCKDSPSCDLKFFSGRSPETPVLLRCKEGCFPMRLRTLFRLFVLFVAFVLCFLLDGIGAGVAMWRMPQQGVFPPLQSDIVHEIFAYRPLGGLLTYLLLVELILVGFSFLLHHDVSIVVAAGLSTSLLSLLRATTTWTTTLYSPDFSCIDCGRAGGCPTTLLGCIWSTLQYYPTRTCGDLNFSGHTLYFVHVALMLHSFVGPRTGARILLWLLWFFTLLCTFGLIVARLHYTTDVQIAWALSLLSWYYTNAQLLPPVMAWLNK